MSEMWLVIDANSILYRHAYSAGKKGPLDGRVFRQMVMHDIESRATAFNARHVAWCWDVGRSRERQALYPHYKMHRTRKQTNPALEKKRKETRRFVNREGRKLRLEILPEIGFHNNFWHRGYEADDMIAHCVHCIRGFGDQAVMISTDNDLLQLLATGISWFSPQTNKRINEKRFFKEHGILPEQWAEVKAIGGCSSDNVRGIHGVGEKTAIRFLKGELGETTVKYKAIVSEEGQAIIERNRPLVTLPMFGSELNALLKHDTAKFARLWPRRIRRI